MFKILILLTFPCVLFANCHYTQKLDYNFDISDIDRLSVSRFVVHEMLNKGYVVTSSSNRTVEFSSRLESSRNRYNVESTLELRINGTLDTYSYGEGRKHKRVKNALRLKNIKKSLGRAINQITSCYND